MSLLPHWVSARCPGSGFSTRVNRDGAVTVQRFSATTGSRDTGVRPGKVWVGRATTGGVVRVAKGRAGVAALCVGALTTACASGTAGRAATVDLPNSTVSAPYAGRLDIPLDYADDATVDERSGSAARALECDTAPYDGGGSNYAEGGPETPQSTVTAAIRDFLTGRTAPMPRTGYRLETRDAGHVLVSFDVANKTKAALVLADNVKGTAPPAGWGVTAWAQCDPAELPASVTAGLGVQVWTDRTGSRVPVAHVHSFAGPADCWPATTFLDLNTGDHPTEYVRRPTPDMAKFLTTSYDPTAHLPADATDTGFRHHSRELWLAPSGQAAYLVDVTDPTKVERWPAATRQVRCG